MTAHRAWHGKRRGIPEICIRLCATALAAVALLAGPGTALAGDPASGGTGINDQGGSTFTAVDLGYTDAYAAAKQQAFDQRHSGATPQVAVATDGLAWTQYHQKTTYNCLPAVGQSMLHFAFGGYASPSVAAVQGTATQAPGTITKGMGTTTDGTNDYTALAWVNGQYQAKGSPWRYVAADDNQYSFQGRMTDEITILAHALYVRVDLTSPNFPWHQTTAAQHATTAVGYSSGGAAVNIADPFGYTSSGRCVVSPYSSSPDVGCIWLNWPTSKYYLAKDVVRGGMYPEWW